MNNTLFFFFNLFKLSLKARINLFLRKTIKQTFKVLAIEFFYSSFSPFARKKGDNCKHVCASNTYTFNLTIFLNNCLNVFKTYFKINFLMTNKY